ncbi:MAG: FAD-binding oxidoreductase, partial [Chloroflexaceae bacterium]|nr:FAD-binding oxidoreductase [Chloroflexaceae bacterium]
MHLENGQSTSIWAASASMPSYAPLTRDTQADVCIVGAGIAGLSTAYQLARAGRRVLVVDDGQPGGGESGRTTAQLTCILDRGYAETEELRGEADARLAAESHMAAIDEIERIVQDEQIDCDFARMDGYYFLAPDDDISTLRDELATARRAGLAVELIDRIPQLGFDSGPALRFPRQGHFHILRYLQGLARAIERMGGTIASGTRIQQVRGGRPVQLETERGLRITANAVVLATNAPINDVLGYSSRVFPYRTYVIGVRVPRGSVGTAIYFDTEEPYHYLRLQPEDGY